MEIDTDPPKFNVDNGDYLSDYEGTYKQQTNKVIKQNWTAIRNFAMYRKYSKLYNLKIENNSISDALNNTNVKTIYEEQSVKFKVQASIGYILLHNQKDELRYWHASSGHNKLFESPIMIENQLDYDSFLDQLRNKDFIENATRSRPNTSYSVHLITNILFFVYPISNHPIGCSSITNVEAIKKNKAIVSALTDCNGRPYENNLCLFRAIALSRKKNATLERTTNEYFSKFINESNADKTEYKGVLLSQLPAIERIFQTSITVFTLDNTNESQAIAKLISRSSTNYPEKIYLHLQQNHFSWIKNLKLYTKSYKCEYCHKLLTTYNSLKNHTLSCSSLTKKVYPSGAYEPPKTLFDKLDQIGIHVDASRRHYPYFAVFDCETYMDKTAVPKNTPTIEWNCQHKLASVSVCTNVAGYRKPVTFINDHENEYEVVEHMMSFLDKVSSICYDRLCLRYNDIFQKLDKARQEAISKEENTSEGVGVEKVQKKYDTLELELDRYITDLLCFGFQSKGFDIPVMKEHIVRYLLESESKINFVVKKGTKYMAIQTEKLRFLDIANFLPQGYSLSDYLKAYQVKESKFFWIYDHFTSMDVLKRTSFPEHHEFYSELKGKNISVDDFNYCKQVWEQENMNSLRDMLIYYNEHDVGPLCSAITKQNSFFKSRNLDFKSAISVPGLAVQYLFQLKNPDNPIVLFGEKFKDLHNLVRNSIRGGLSLVFCRLQEAGKTKIKEQYFGENAKPTKVCEGWDCSSMYLHNLALCDMPTGGFVRRQQKNGFKAERSHSYGNKATEWVLWLENKLNVKLQHMHNGNEVKIGGRELPVDGYGETKNGEKIVLNYSGCWYHSHMCKYATTGKGGEYEKDLENQLETYKNLQYFKDLGYKVHHIWECEFDCMKANDKQIQDFCNGLDFVVDKRNKLSEKQILSEVKDGKLFGMVEVDLHTPEKYKDAFSEFQAITKHAQMSREDVSEHMKTFAEENGLLKKPTKTLLNSYFAEKILVATPVLQWYLHHGIVCTKVHQVIQYKPAKCFQKFAEEVVSARRDGDNNPSNKIISDNCKLIGMHEFVIFV